MIRALSRALPALLIAASLDAAAAEGRSEAALRLAELQAWLAGTRTLEARFEQAIVSGALGAGVVERGRLWIERPGRMRWDYREPERKVALLDGGRTWLYLEADRELLLGRLEESGDLLPALLAGAQPLAELFEPSLPEADEAGVTLVLTPRSEEAELERIDLALAGGAIEWARVVDATGQRIELRLSGVKRNRPLPPSTFSFAPPAGTAVSGSHDPVEGAPVR